jgi:hypothetical protein
MGRIRTLHSICDSLKQTFILAGKGKGTGNGKGKGKAHTITGRESPQAK